MAAGSLAQGLRVALPLTLVHDTGYVGPVWREPTPGPALAAVLQAFVDASAIVNQPDATRRPGTRAGPQKRAG